MALRSIRRKIQNSENEKSTLTLLNSKIEDLSEFLLNKENIKVKHSSPLNRSPLLSFAEKQCKTLDCESEMKRMKGIRNDQSSKSQMKGNSRFRFQELIKNANEESFSNLNSKKQDSHSVNSKFFSYFTNYAKKTNTDSIETIRKVDESLSTQPQFETPRLTIPTEEHETFDEKTEKFQISTSNLNQANFKSSRDEKIEKLETKIASLIAENSRLSQKIQDGGAAYQLLRKKSFDITKETELQNRVKALESENKKLKEENSDLSSALTLSQENEKDLGELNLKLTVELKAAISMIHELQVSLSTIQEEKGIIEELRIQNEQRGAEISAYIRLLEEKEKQISVMKSSQFSNQSMKCTREMIADRFEESISFNSEENPTYPFKKRSLSAFGRRV